jgi:hypothetical protein
MKNLVKLISFIAAVILSALLFPVGLVFNLTELRHGRVFVTFWRFFIELVDIIFDFLLNIAVIFDRLGNVIIGDMIERLVTKEMNTTFGKNEWTISASLGKLLYDNKLKPFGLRFIGFIDSVFGTDHCIDAYYWHVEKENFNNENIMGVS